MPISAQVVAPETLPSHQFELLPEAVPKPEPTSTLVEVRRVHVEEPHEPSDGTVVDRDADDEDSVRRQHPGQLANRLGKIRYVLQDIERRDEVQLCVSERKRRRRTLQQRHAWQ